MTRSIALAGRNYKEMTRDWMSLGVNVALPIALLLVLQALESVDDFFAPASLAPGVVLFGYAMLTMTSAMSLAQDRESSLFARLLTTPMRANEFVVAYSLPYLAIAAIQALIVYAIAVPLGAGTEGDAIWIVVVLALMAVLYVGLGMLIGATVPYKAVTGPWMAVLLLTIFGGTWVNLADIGGVFESVAAWFPFAHALDAIRGVALEGAGWGDIAGDVAWVAGYAAAVVVVAVAVFRRRMVV
jgi:ABC-2 type transport system permease protein